MTFVIQERVPLRASASRRPLGGLLAALDPRGSLMGGIVWLVILLAASFSIAASIWVGRLARENILEQHVRRLSLETDQLGSDLGQAVSARLGAIRAAAAIVRAAAVSGQPMGLRAVFAELLATYPELDWIALADAHGHVAASREPGGSRLAIGAPVEDRDWFKAGLNGPWIGVIEEARTRPGDAVTPRGGDAALGELAAPVRSASGEVIGVVTAHLSWRAPPSHLPRLTQGLEPGISAEALVLGPHDIVLVGPATLRGRPWTGTPLPDSRSIAPERQPESERALPDPPRFERLPGGSSGLVVRSPVAVRGATGEPLWRVQLSEPNARVYQRADALAAQILWVSLGLGALTAIAGALGARHLTGRLKGLTDSVAAVGRNDAARIDVPPGHDEVARLAAAFARILEDLQRERGELRSLSSELERRVAVRTREVERLAEESRYTAVVRERLKIARDLHDTLAHSMMAMLSEVRLLRRLQARDPALVAEELERAERVAHEGLKEARTAIAQMRVNAVRDTGLGAALGKAFERFIDRTGLKGEFSADGPASSVGDERAETLFRMAEEALRNIERHAMATRVSVTLRVAHGTHIELVIEDNGVGFDPLALEPGHFGLIGLREQAQLIGAEIEIRAAPNEGATVRVSFPMSPESL